MNHSNESGHQPQNDPYGFDAGCDCGDDHEPEAHRAHGHPVPADRTGPIGQPSSSDGAPGAPFDPSAYPPPVTPTTHAPPPPVPEVPRTATPEVGVPEVGSGPGVVGVDPAVGKQSMFTRRRFIQGLVVGGTVGYGVVRGSRPVDQSKIESQLASRSAVTPGIESGGQSQVVTPNVDAVLDDFSVLDENALLTPAPVDQRVLVLIEFQGGNDGLSTVVPYGIGSYYDQRPRLAIPAENVIPIDEQVGFNPALASLAQRQIATVEGVGPVDGSLSHFEMVERWDQGDMLGSGGSQTGFLARIADSVDLGGAVTGLSVAGHTPRFGGVTASTIALSNLNQLRVLTNDDWIYPRYRSAMRNFGGGPMAATMVNSWAKLFDVGDAMGGDVGELDGDSPMVQEGGQLGRQLAMAAELITADVGVRVVHATLDGFDTHEGHQYRHERLMQRFDAAVDGFLQQVADAGMAERVLVATCSEFGRRVRENGGGLDHGAGSSMLLIGPVAPGRNGEMSPLTDLDGNDNLKTTVPFDRYLATVAQDWLGVDAASVLPGGPQPLGLFQA